MSAIINIGNLSPVSSMTYPPTTGAVMPASGAQEAESDHLELSTLGQALSQATELSSLSVARVRAIRAEIANGTFETPERISGTAARLLDVLG
jgi:anti-sigma28 factor (negative regulator of flagellin synthesis)